jgi:hypothetical protein
MTVGSRELAVKIVETVVLHVDYHDMLDLLDIRVEIFLLSRLAATEEHAAGNQDNQVSP